MAEDSDYSLFKKVGKGLSQGTVGDPRTSMFDAPGSLGGLSPIRFEEKVASEPAITGERKVTFSKPFAGAAFIETYKNVLDHSKITPIISVEEAYKTKGVDIDNDNFKNTIMQARGFTFKDPDGKRDEQGNIPTQQALFTKAESYESRLNKLNAGKAISLDFEIQDKLGGRRSFNQPIPYSSITEQYTTTPKDLNEYVVNLNPFSDRKVEDRTKWDAFTAVTADNEVLNVMMAQNMVQTLRNNGFSERNIAGIMKHRVSLPTAFGFGAGDVSNLRGVFTDIARFPVEAGGYLLTEALDATLIGVDYFTPEGREEFLERFFPRMPGLILNRYDQLGLDIDYHQAERLSRMMSGIGTKTVALAMETVGATTTAKTVKYAAGKKEIANFKLYEQNQRTKFPDITQEDILQGYQAMRRSQLGVTFNSTKIHDEVLNFPVIGGAVSTTIETVGAVTAKINGLRTSSALKAGFEIEEAALSVSKKPEVRKFVAFRNNKRQEIIGIRNRASDENRPLTIKEVDRIDSLKLDVSRTETQLRRIVAQSNVPKFMRDSKRLDAAVVLGGATAYTTAQAHGGDEMFWEFLGSGAGMALYGFSKVPGGAVDVIKRMKAGGTFNPFAVRGDIKLASRLAENLVNFEPEFRDAVLARVRYFNGLSSALRGEGIPSNLLERSASNIISLAVLQTLEEGMRVGLDAPSTAEFGEAMQQLEKNRTAQQELLSELQGLFVRLRENENAVVDGTATNKLYTTVQAAMDNAKGKIDQLESDLGVLSRNYSNTVLGMIEGTPNGSLARIAPGSEKSMAEVFDRLHDYGIERITPGKAAQIKTSIDEKADKVADSILAQARQIVTNALPTTTDRAKDTILSVMSAEKPETLPKAADVAGGLPNFKKPGDLLALLMESTYSADKAKAALPYKELNGQIFRMRGPDGNLVPVNGAAFSDGGDILDTIVSASKSEDNAEFLTAINPNTAAMSPLNKILGTLEQSANAVISQVATKNGMETEDVIQAAFERAAANREPLTKNVPRAVAAVNYMRKEAQKRGGDIEVFPLNFIQLRELQQASGNLARSAERAGKGQAQATYLQIRNGATAAFGNFVVETPEGQRIPANDLIATLTMPNGSSQDVTVKEGVAMANAGWSSLMSKYQDNPLIRSWMGFQDFQNGARVSVDASADNPLGMTFGKNKPNTWIDVKAWSRKSTTEQQNNLTSLANIIGVDTPDGKKINIDTPKGQAFQEILAANYREFILDALERGDMTPDEFETISRNFEKAFVGVNNVGTEVRLVNTDRMFNQIMNFSEGSVGKVNFEKGMTMYKNAAQEVAAQTARDVGVIKKGLDDSVRFLQNYTADRVDASNLASQIISGGPQRLSQLRTHLFAESGMSEQDINMILRSVLQEAIEAKAFKATNTYIPLVGKGQIVQKFEMDLGQLNEILGVNNPEVKTVVQDILGEKNYKTYMDVLAFMSEQNVKVKSEGVRFTGIPRDFSIESYISRFYAINRGVVSFRYVGTEAILQQMRNNNMSLLTQMISNPRVGEIFMEMVSTGRPLPKEKETEFFQMLVVGLERHLATHEGSDISIPVLYDNEETGHTFKYTKDRGYEHLDEAFVP